MAYASPTPAQPPPGWTPALTEAGFVAHVDATADAWVIRWPVDPVRLLLGFVLTSAALMFAAFGIIGPCRGLSDEETIVPYSRTATQPLRVDRSALWIAGTLQLSLGTLVALWAHRHYFSRRRLLVRPGHLHLETRWLTGTHISVLDPAFALAIQSDLGDAEPTRAIVARRADNHQHITLLIAERTLAQSLASAVSTLANPTHPQAK